MALNVLYWLMATTAWNSHARADDDGAGKNCATDYVIALPACEQGLLHCCQRDEIVQLHLSLRLSLFS